VQVDEIPDALEDRPQTSRGLLPGARVPPPEVHGPEAPVVFVDDSVSACSRARVDSEDFHVQRLGGGPDIPPAAADGYAEAMLTQRRTEATWPNPSVAVTVAW
jgi:hypothetical protein